MADDFVDDDEDAVPSQPSEARSDLRTTTRISPMERKRTRDEPETFSRNKTAVLDEYEQEFAGKKTSAGGEERQRELRRMRQIRYRKKKFDLTMRLEENTVQLRNEVRG
ncbi:hypothetical protein V7S43_003827 [Phytophthora oleae]|uniref:BZIP domain-containing protein n=1 Tax=Phytophthora oleae TaxID=2107226 RepID=A0ABD3FUM6_9STRA